MTIQIGFVRRYEDATGRPRLGDLDEFYGLRVEGDTSALTAEARALIAAAETQAAEHRDDQDVVKQVAHELAQQLKALEVEALYAAFRGDDLESYHAALASNRKRQQELARQAAELD